MFNYTQELTCWDFLLLPRRISPVSKLYPIHTPEDFSALPVKYFYYYLSKSFTTPFSHTPEDFSLLRISHYPLGVR